MKLQLRIAFQQLTNLSDGLYTSKLIINMHDAHKNRILAQSRSNIIYGHMSCRIDFKLSDLKAFFLKLLHDLIYRGMLYATCNNMLATIAERTCNTLYSQIIRFCSA